VAAHRLADVLDLGLADAELQRDVAVLFLVAHGDDLAVVDLEDGHRHMAAVLVEHPRHPDFLRDHSGTHGAVLRAARC
jgi:hypothetical protein